MVSTRLRDPKFLLAAAVFCACIAAWFFYWNSPFPGHEKKNALQLALEQDWTGLINFATERTEKDAGNAEMWFYRGYAQYKLGRFPEAQSAFEKVVQLSPEFPDAHVSLGVIAASHRNYKRAIEYYLAALKYRPGYPLAQQNLAISYYFNGQHDMAWDAWRDLEKFDPERAKAIQSRFLFTDARPQDQRRGSHVSAMASTPATRRPPPCPECAANR